MRPSQALSSGTTPTGKTYTGWWGNFSQTKQKGIVQYGLSSYQQKPFAGVFRGYLFGGFSRIMHQIPYFALPFASGYFVYTWGKTKYEYYNSKEGHHAMAHSEGH
ncbi:cytochrome b-c1 complex subunit 8 [Dioszegia hungarica]|uniref:Cytochrome b-c1 complex subunit 8 n=1 Tax=Dioszegia hungarica TaxID=4972 RepID=A0AA38H384_9TREE|nr:cytochrome b-c1 complex subunit 8 [Dioszegia hungarica]KAI9633408.1 cytochrome b-c1 complex subunit 8 [Dioszegia hungarica]